jgi:hypothetical protein
MSESTPEYVTVSQAAAALGISERTVQRRCKSGKVRARLVTTETGQLWEVEAATLPTGADRVTPRFKRELIADANVPTGAATSDAIPDDRVTTVAATGDDSAQTVQLARMQGFMAGQMETAIARAISAANAPLLDEIRLLRADIEAMKETARNAQEAPQAGGTNNHARPAASVAQSGARREMRPLWKVVLGIR